MFIPVPDDHVHSYVLHKFDPQLKKVKAWATKQNMQVQNKPSNVGNWKATQQLWMIEEMESERHER